MLGNIGNYLWSAVWIASAIVFIVAIVLLKKKKERSGIMSIQIMSAMKRVEEMKETVERLRFFVFQWDYRGKYLSEEEARIEAAYLVELLDPTILNPMKNRPKDYPAQRVVEVHEVRHDELSAPRDGRKVLTLKTPTKEQA